MTQQTYILSLTGGRGDPPNDPNGAGWPSTTGNPSGDGRGNNDIRLKSFGKGGGRGQPPTNPNGGGWPAGGGRGPGGGRGNRISLKKGRGQPPVGSKHGWPSKTGNPGGKAGGNPPKGK